MSKKTRENRGKPVEIHDTNDQQLSTLSSPLSVHSQLSTLNSQPSPVRNQFTLNSQLSTLNSQPSTTSLFTLIELLVVIAVIGILAAMLMPAYQQVREIIKVGSTETELKSLEVALIQYYRDWGEYPPDADGAEKLVDCLEDTQKNGPYYEFDEDRIKDGKYEDLLGEENDRDIWYYMYEKKNAGDGVWVWSAGLDGEDNSREGDDIANR